LPKQNKVLGEGTVDGGACRANGRETLMDREITELSILVVAGTILIHLLIVLREIMRMTIYPELVYTFT